VASLQRCQDQPLGHKVNTGCKYFELKEESIGPPKPCATVELECSAKAWAFGSLQYIQAAMKYVETYLEKQEENFQGNRDSNPDHVQTRT
jgi:hypothetical protein